MMNQDDIEYDKFNNPRIIIKVFQKVENNFPFMSRKYARRSRQA